MSIFRKKAPTKGAEQNTKKKKSAEPEKAPEKSKQKKAVGNIYKTTDGYLSGNKNVKKHRRVAVIKQRKDDGAVAVVKIYGKKNKDTTAKNIIPNLTLDPKNHSSLTQPSIVGRQVIIGRKEDNSPRAIYPEELHETDDKLTTKEKRTIKKEVHNDTPQHRKTFKEKIKKWRNHFKK